MRFFFQSRQFKIIATVVAIVLTFSIISAILGTSIAPQANLVGTITAPFRSLATKISDGVSDAFKAYSDGNELMVKNSELEKEIGDLRKKLAKYDSAISENEFYKNYMGIKETNPDFKFCDAVLISRDDTDPYKGFTINRGSMHGIEKYDPVISDSGLVGYVTQVGISTSKVTTILSTAITLGAIDNRTSDSGIISGDLKMTEKGYCKLYNLSRSCNVAIGDYIITSGEGVFPDGLLVGTIESIDSDAYNTSIYASIKPFVNFSDIRGVMVITDFDGKVGVITGGENK